MTRSKDKKEQEALEVIKATGERVAAKVKKLKKGKA